ncbi:MAG TPA: HAMP domain-containing sensor histidine kinase [Acidimicrobiales bacterium]|nr:HAMP domain-containing sensor histidine kinase [Acidimicrobiales bacterium]
MSLRLRLGLGLGLVAVVLVVVAVVVARTTQADLVARVDEQIRLSARAAVEFRPGRPGGPAGGGGVEDPSDRPGPSTIWVGVSDGTRVVTLASPRTAGSEAATPRIDRATLAALEARPGRIRTVPGDGGVERFRVVARVRPGGTTLVGAPLDDVDAAVRRLVAVEVGATTLVLAVLALVAFWVLRLGVRPLKRMTATATDIAAGDLSHRVPEADPRTEAGELGVALNRMLGRIEEAFAERTASEERLRRFVADASHELRTPITTIRGYAELHRHGGLEDPEARRAAMERTEQEAVRMGALVDDLLLLARLDQGRPLERAPVDLGAVAADTVADATVAHPGHTVALDRAPGPLVVAGDDHRLRQVVANLVGNATHHTPDGTTVTVRLAAEPARPGLAAGPGAVVLEVADDGPGMAPEVAARAFERFARGDVSRSRRSGGSGLGLSIVAAIVAAHGGTVALRSAPGQGTTVAVRLPGAA